MSGNIKTREFAISDYDTALELWQRVEGLEIAEGDDREGVSHFLARNPGLSRVATDGAAHCAVTTDAADIFIIWRLILLTRRAELAGV